MKKRFTEEQVAYALKRNETGTKVGDICRETGVPDTSFYRGKAKYAGPWENGYIESFNGKLRDELLGRGIFDRLYATQVLIKHGRIEYNTISPQIALGYRPPAPETIQPRWLNQHNYWYN